MIVMAGRLDRSNYSHKRKHNLDDGEIENILDLVLTPPKRLKVKTEYRKPPNKETTKIASLPQLPILVANRPVLKKLQVNRNKARGSRVASTSNRARNNLNRLQKKTNKSSKPQSTKGNDKTKNVKKVKQKLSYKPVSLASHTKQLVSKSPGEDVGPVKHTGTPTCKTRKSASKSLSMVFSELSDDERDIFSWQPTSPDTWKFFKTKPSSDSKTPPSAVPRNRFTSLFRSATSKVIPTTATPVSDPMMKRLEDELLNDASDNDSMLANPPTPLSLRTPQVSTPGTPQSLPATNFPSSSRTVLRLKRSNTSTLAVTSSTIVTPASSTIVTSTIVISPANKRLSQQTNNRLNHDDVVKFDSVGGDSSNGPELAVTSVRRIQQESSPLRDNLRRSPRKSLSSPAPVTPSKRDYETARSQGATAVSSGYDSSSPVTSTTSLGGSEELYTPVEGGTAMTGGGDTGDRQACDSRSDDVSSPSLRRTSRRTTLASNSNLKKFFKIFDSPSPLIAQSKLFQKSPNKSPKSQSSPRTRRSDTKEQMIIDAGQKSLGASQCDGCGMLFSSDNPPDDATHARFHKNVVNTVKFQGWKNERVVREYIEDEARVLLVVPESPAYVIKKVTELNKLMAQELGFSDSFLSTTQHYKVFVYVCDKKMVGCCVAEPVSQGYHVIPDHPSQTTADRAWTCDTTPHTAAVGIGRIWVYCNKRRNGIATKLLDCVRHHFVYGSVVDKTSVAFSDPTPDGMKLATRYTGMRDFLVYKYSSS